MKFSGDIMGYANDIIEQNLGGISLFMNGDAGDIDPASGMCDSVPGNATFFGSIQLAKSVLEARANVTTTTDNISFQAFSNVVNFGLSYINFTLSRFDNCTIGGPLDICSICEVLNCELPLRMDSAWITNDPVFTAFSINVNKEITLVVTLPGEALVELGWEIYNDSASLGYDRTFLAGYSQAHMGYFATPDQYDIGGYESELTLFGINTSAMVRSGAFDVASRISPLAMQFFEPKELKLNNIFLYKR